jgi:flavodoxin I
MVEIGIFFGSDTGNTENVAKIIKDELGEKITKLYDIADSTKEDIESFDILLLGIPTWYYGESQCDWDDFLPTLKEISFEGKLVALFGCGDQEDYAEYFCDAMGTVHDVIEPNGATIIGYWPTEGYSFEASKSLIDSGYFVGLAIDDDRQPELTKQRIKAWVNQVSNELQLGKLIKD